ncbi:LmeA family phospholipid-binding protein [Microbacterium album]|uniref:DUF2993 domain-containing protein n=1 Tax=Microbacterium album TaxID=2053191 RepID=A0A917IIF3_9MICO|nr:DUF2993 domain-containing protein [Microbacterium album]GGH48929.1 hypothetical protein GCM10010921_26760 [Microbacterium album]
MDAGQSATVRRPARRRRWPWALLVAVVVLAALAGAAELAARAIVPQQVRQAVVAQLGMPADQQLDVAVGGGLLVPQLIAGRLDDLRISGDEVPLEDVVADVDVHLTGVALRDGAAGGPGTAELRLDATAVESLLARADLPAILSDPTIGFAAPDVAVVMDLPIFGTSIPIDVTLTPEAAEGRLVLRPTGASVGGARVSAEQLAGMTGLDLPPVDVCVADRFPAGLALHDVAVEGDALVARLAIEAGAMSDPVLREPGTC